MTKDLHEEGSKTLMETILPEKNLTPEQTEQVKQNAEEQQKELDEYIQRFLNKPLR